MLYKYIDKKYTTKCMRQYKLPSIVVETVEVQGFDSWTVVNLARASVEY